MKGIFIRMGKVILLPVVITLLMTVTIPSAVIELLLVTPVYYIVTGKAYSDSVADFFHKKGQATCGLFVISYLLNTLERIVTDMI